MEKICVAVRVRPPARDERVKRNQWKVAQNTISLYNGFGTPVPGHSFAFDYVFGTEVRNRSIYEVHTKEVIMAALHGFNGTVFAYGQTSSGKTYTMQGSDDDPGLIGLTVHEVFSNLQKIVDREFLIRVSYMEIYNEDINDLVAPENRKLQIHENLERGIFVAGLREEIVNSPEQVFELLKFGEARRHIGQTNMNVYSSRSHTIFRMVIESKDKSQNFETGSCSDAVRVSVLNLVDLAGSERVAKTGADGTRLREGTHINKSLMTLGTVIKKLSDGTTKQGGHIPYRDSKLTRILQPALGGNAKTAIICTVAPEEAHIDETRGTLQFASRAKRVTTCAQVNEIITDAALLKRQKKEIEELRNKLQGFHSEVLEQEILHLRNDLLKFELEREKLALELQEERKAHQEREQRIKEQEQKIENLSSLFITSALDEYDQEKLEKKGTDQEYVHTRRFSLELPSQELRRYTGKRPSEESFNNNRVTLRRENLLTPPAFQALLGTSGEKGSKYARKVDDFLVPRDFGNIADEDMWLSLNNGHTQAEPNFLDFTPGNNISSLESAKARKVSFIHDALKNSNVEIEKIKSQLDEVLKEKSELQNQLQEQLTFQNQFENVILEMEREVGSAQLVTDSLQEIWNNCRQTQASISASLQEIVAVETSLMQPVIMRIEELKDNDCQRLEEKIRTLEVELLSYKQENVELRAKSQALELELVSYKQDNLELQAKSHALQEQVDLSNASLVIEADEAVSTEGIRPRLKRKLGPRKQIGSEALSGQNQDDLYAAPNDMWPNNQQRKGSLLDMDRDGTTSNTMKASKKEKVSNPNDRDTFMERLQMSHEHIRVLERQLVLAKLEKKSTRKALTEQLQENESSALAMNLEKLILANKFGRFIEMLAVEDTSLDSICYEIRKFEEQMEKQNSPALQQGVSQFLACTQVC